MKLGYNTNGLAHHRLLDAIDLLADVGFQSVAITLDVQCLDPFGDPHLLAEQIAQTRHRLDERGLDCVIETGARYLLNPRKKHDPTLLDADPARRKVRIDFLTRSIEIARLLEAPVASIWSGHAPEGTPAEAAFERLLEGLRVVADRAANTGVVLGFEPEPGMFIDTMEKFEQLVARFAHPALQLTLDVGHVHCIEEQKVVDSVRRWGARLVNVHIEDMVRGVHEHLPFGQGTMDFPPILKALAEVQYQGGVHVELSRDSHRAVEAVCESYNFLSPLVRGVD